MHSGQLRMAYRLANSTHRNRLLHVYGVGWHRWDGRRWAYDDQGHAVRAVRDVLRRALQASLDLATDAAKAIRRDVDKCSSATGAAGVLALAASMAPFAATVADLDADPYLLNVANGILDLRTGQLRDHDPADRCTKVTAAAYRPEAGGEEWATFLNRVLPNPEVRAFLQRLTGVALLGRVVEHVLPIATGVGANGKGVFTRSVEHALGDYASTAESDLFMSRDGAHPTGEMDLLGRRWVTVSETDHGRRLAEATMKRLTGGDTIKARRMRQDFVEFVPSHTPLLVTNHLPAVRGDDPAIWRRIRVVPFDVVIPEAERDKHLDERLQLQAEAVLTWAVAGWRDYSDRGDLGEPEAVKVATRALPARLRPGRPVRRRRVHRHPARPHAGRRAVVPLAEVGRRRRSAGDESEGLRRGARAQGLRRRSDQGQAPSARATARSRRRGRRMRRVTGDACDATSCSSPARTGREQTRRRVTRVTHAPEQRRCRGVTAPSPTPAASPLHPVRHTRGELRRNPALPRRRLLRHLPPRHRGVRVVTSHLPLAAITDPCDECGGSADGCRARRAAGAGRCCRWCSHADGESFSGSDSPRNPLV